MIKLRDYNKLLHLNFNLITFFGIYFFLGNSHNKWILMLIKCAKHCQPLSIDNQPIIDLAKSYVFFFVQLRGIETIKNKRQRDIQHVTNNLMHVMSRTLILARVSTQLFTFLRTCLITIEENVMYIYLILPKLGLINQNLEHRL